MTEVFCDKALGKTVERLGKMIAHTGPERGQGAGRHHYFQVTRFANTLGTSS